MCVNSPVYTSCHYWKWMLPEPDWKAEDQLGVRARTSGGYEDKDNDDDQGGEIPAWMFEKKSTH